MDRVTGKTTIAARELARALRVPGAEGPIDRVIDHLQRCEPIAFDALVEFAIAVASHQHLRGSTCERVIPIVLSAAIERERRALDRLRTFF